MQNERTVKKRGGLTREILGLFCAVAAIALFFFGFLSATADSLVLTYCERYEIIFTEIQEWTVQIWIRSISFATALLLFVVLFLFLLGQKIAYLKDIIRGIDALRTQRMEYKMPIEGNNELTELAESINFLARSERELKRKEMLMQEEREGLIRALSHDIRTPLTAMLSYSQYMRECVQQYDVRSGESQNSQAGIRWDPKEMENYIGLMLQKAEQIKSLTDRLLEGGGRTLEKFENGKFLMEQLAEKWEDDLEDNFDCCTDLGECPEFAGEFDIQELHRIFDNLASNVKKYADEGQTVALKICERDGYLRIEQQNGIKQNLTEAESHKIGLESIRKIAEGYGGTVEVARNGQEFQIHITLIQIN